MLERKNKEKYYYNKKDNQRETFTSYETPTCYCLAYESSMLTTIL